MNKALNKKILEHIDAQDLKPTSKTYFQAKEVVLWLGVMIALLLAGILAGSFGIQISNTMVLPPILDLIFGLVRIGLILLVLLFALVQILNTEKGYKRTKKLYMSIGIFCAVGIGSLLFFTNISGNIEPRIGQSGIINQSKDHWTQPESGLLAAELQEITDDGYLIMKDFNNNYHIVDTENLPEDKQDLFIDFLRVRMIGFEDGDIFYPCSVAPWELRGSPRQTKDGYILQRDNVQFSKGRRSHEVFKNIFERKSEIVRTNKC